MGFFCVMILMFVLLAADEEDRQQPEIILFPLARCP